MNPSRSDRAIILANRLAAAAVKEIEELIDERNRNRMKKPETPPSGSDRAIILANRLAAYELRELEELIDEMKKN